MTSRGKESILTLSVGIVIPYFNGSSFIEDALSSVSAQTVKPKACLVVDDGSSQKESAFLEGLKSKYDFSILRVENRGQSAARNAGVRLLQTDLVCFLDQDDCYLGDHIQSVVDAFNDEVIKPHFVFGYAISVDKSLNLEDAEGMRRMSAMPKRSLAEWISQDAHVLPSALAVRSDVFAQVGGFDERLVGYEDDDLCLRLFLAGFKHEFIDKPSVKYRRHDSNTYNSSSMAASRGRFFTKWVFRLASSSETEAQEAVRLLAERLFPSFKLDLRDAARRLDLPLLFKTSVYKGFAMLFKKKVPTWSSSSDWENMTPLRPILEHVRKW